MAEGEFFRFNQFKLDQGRKIHDLVNDEIKFFAMKGAAQGGIDPAKGTADPRYGAGGSTDLSTHECAAGGNYATGGMVVSCTWTADGDNVKFDSDDTAPQISWAKHASNPTNARYIIGYNNTASGKQCIGFIDLGAVKDMTAGDLNLSANVTNGFFVEG